MTADRFREIFEEDSDDSWKKPGDHTLMGLNLLAKYSKNQRVIQGADHDVIYLGDISELIEAGITEEDATQLRNWGFNLSENEYLQCFV